MHPTFFSWIRIRHLINSITLLLVTTTVADEPRFIIGMLQPVDSYLRELSVAPYEHEGTGLPVVQVTYRKPVSLDTEKQRFIAVSSSEHLPKGQLRIRLSLAGEDWEQKQELIDLLRHETDDILDIKFSGFDSIKDSTIVPLAREIRRHPDSHQISEIENQLLICGRIRVAT